MSGWRRAAADGSTMMTNIIAVRSTTPPANPRDGQRWILPVDATNGVNWEFVYNAGSASAYKWEFIGGAPLEADVPGMGNESTGSSTYTDLGTVGPTLTAPRPGDYIVEFGARMFNTTNGASTAMSIAIGGAAAAEADRIDHFTGASFFAAAGAGFAAHHARTQRKTFSAATTVVQAKYRADGTATSYFSGRWLRLTPVRVS